MRYDLRKHHRVELNYVARVLSLGGETICDCALLDVSQGGARIEVLASEIVPDEFLLVFSASSSVSRKCKVAWRKAENIGITFLKVVDTAAAKKAMRRTRLLETRTS